MFEVALFDRDGDGWGDRLEDNLGSSSDRRGSTPEHIALAYSCMDGRDNDRDGKVDGADTGCHAQPAFTESFPRWGSRHFASRLMLDEYMFPTLRGPGPCPVSFWGEGPTVVQRWERTWVMIT